MLILLAVAVVRTASATHVDPDVLFVDGIESCSMMADSAGDRLGDCAEVLVHRTDPQAADTDGDALNDGDEVLGTLAGLDLPAFGVNPRRRDILVEHDWVVDNADPGFCGPHSHRPSDTKLGSTVVAFAAAPVQNVDGSFGVNVINDFGQGGVFNGGNEVAIVDGFLPEGLKGALYHGIRAANFTPNRVGIFHYALHAHAFDDQGSKIGRASGWGRV